MARHWRCSGCTRRWTRPGPTSWPARRRRRRVSAPSPRARSGPPSRASPTSSPPAPPDPRPTTPSRRKEASDTRRAGANRHPICAESSPDNSAKGVGSGAQEGEELVALAADLLQVGGVGEHEVGDAQLLVLPQRRGDVVGRADEPGRAGAATAELPGRRVEVVVEHLAPRRQVEEALLTDGLEAGVGPLERVLTAGHLGHLRLRVRPGLLRGVAHEGGDPQPELQRRVLAAELPGQPGEAPRPLADAPEG